jgi:hypothetical protein
VGALLVFLPFGKFAKPQLSLLAALGLLFSAFIYNEQTPFPGTAAVIPVLATALLILSSQKWPPILDGVAQARIIQWLGEISYPLYLWHWPVLVIPSIYWARSLTSVEKVLLLIGTVVLADLTHRFIEEPFRYRKWSSALTFKVSFVSTVALVLAGTAIFSTYSNTINITGTNSDGGKYSLDEIKAKWDNYADGCHLILGQTVSPNCEYGDVTSTRTIVLYGDSHASHWLPALDLIGHENQIKIVSLTKSACPSAEVIKEVDGQYKVAECQAFRDSSIARIASIRPLAVIATGSQPASEPYSNKDGLAWWLKGESVLYQRIHSLTKYPIYISDTPMRTVEVPDCLAAALGAICDIAKKVNPKVADGFLGIDPTPWLCDTSCPALIDGVVTYRDHSHLTIAMSKHLAPNLLAALKRIGAL